MGKVEMMKKKTEPVKPWLNVPLWPFPKDGKPVPWTAKQVKEYEVYKRSQAEEALL
jgi:hypothetical protein